MGTLLMVVGGLWALLGLANLVGMFGSGTASEGVMMFGLLFNMLVFVLPGLGLAGIGAMLRKRSSGAGGQGKEG